MTESPQITVRVLKYDGTEYRQWGATLTHKDDSLLVLDAAFEDDVSHPLLGEIRSGTRTIEYYWLNRWYNVSRFLESDGTTKLFYCNVSMPPQFNEGVLSYIDLDMDILVQPDSSYQVLDLEEFEVNVARFGYPGQVRTQARKAVDELISMIEHGEFPFS